MIFQSRYRNETLVARKWQRTVHPGGIIEDLPSLIAKFTGPNRLFDSEQAQERHGWTDEERIFVENKVLGSRKFGSGIYLAFGQEVPEDRLTVIRPDAQPTKTRKRCAFIGAESGEIVQCPKESVPGGEFCDDHKEKAGITKGMLTATGGTIK